VQHGDGQPSKHTATPGSAESKLLREESPHAPMVSEVCIWAEFDAQSTITKSVFGGCVESFTSCHRLSRVPSFIIILQELIKVLLRAGRNTSTRLVCCIDTAMINLPHCGMTCSSSLDSKSVLPCVSLSDRDGLQVQHGDEQPSKHTSTPGSAGGSASVSESRVALPAETQHDHEIALAAEEYDSSDEVPFTGTSVQPPNASSLGEGSAGGGAGRKRGRENASVSATEEGEGEQPMSLNLD